MSIKKGPLSPAPKLIEDLLQKIVGPIGAAPISKILFEPDNIEDRVTLLLEMFELHPEFKAPFERLIKSLQGGQQDVRVPLEEQIRFFSTKHTRYWLLVNLVNRVLRLRELKMDYRTGRLPSRAHDILKYAHKAREAYGESSRYKDVVFAAGLMFDFLFYLQRTPFLDLGEIRYDDYLHQCFLRAVDQGKRIMGLCKYKNELELEFLTPVTAFLRQLAHVSLIMLKAPESLEFYKKLEVSQTSEPLIAAMEMQRYQVHTGMIASFLAQTFPIFGKLPEIMSFWGFPYVCNIRSKMNIHDVACMGMLGIAISEKGVNSSQFGPSGKPNLELPELRYLDFQVTKEVRDEVEI